MIRVVIESAFGRNEDGTRCTPAQYARNARYLDRAIRDSLSRGEAPYASHGFFPAPGRLDDTDQDQRNRGIHAGQAWGSCGQLIAIYRDHGITEGMTRSIDIYHALRIPVVYRLIGAEPDWDTEPAPALSGFEAAGLTVEQFTRAMCPPHIPHFQEPTDAED